ncbi:hypothetical protein AMECASPLE_030735 [Ameca splendens]|uniref:Uncharacterized protein n=1 Tax=Ameca splendens TaxID=208324 RepID=A0ABV0XJ23_9TELE
MTFYNVDPLLSVLFRLFKKTQPQNNKPNKMLNFLQQLLTEKSLNTVDCFPTIHKIKSDTVHCAVLRIKLKARPSLKTLFLQHSSLSDSFSYAVCLKCCSLWLLMTYNLQFITLGLKCVKFYWFYVSCI